jgi:hypothetical protein
MGDGIATVMRPSHAQMIGRAHVESGAPCQDHAAALSACDVVCIALADGAGSRVHSGYGAEIVVNETVAFVCNHFEDLFHDLVVARRLILDRLIDALRQGIQGRELPILDLASTLLFVAQKDDRYIAGHIGDGVIAGVGMQGVETLSHPDNGEFANSTFFVTDETASEHFRLYKGIGWWSGFVLMSDGVAESLYQKATGKPAIAVEKLLQWNTRLPRDEMEKVLQVNLEQFFTRNSTDDCSIALLS